MNREKAYFGLFLGLVVFIILHKNFLILLGNVETFFRKDNSIELEQKKYNSKIEDLERQILEYEKSYNNLKIYEPSTYVLAKISLREIYDFYDFMMVSTDTLVTKGSAVINEDGLVGIVKDVDGKIAKIGLLTGKEKVSVRIAASYGLIDGYSKEEKMLIVRNINNYEKIAEGDIVETSGLNDIPGGLKIGSVQKIELKGIEKIIYVKSFVDFDNLNYLYIVSK